jgi:hypothetical protein
MPADWTNFILTVGNKLDGKQIQGSYDPGAVDVDDFSVFLTNQYVQAITSKAQSPYGNLAQKGNDTIITLALNRAFKLLEEERSPTLDEKIKDPLYVDLTEPIPVINVDEQLDKFDLAFLAWAEANGADIPDFVYSLFFSQFPNFPTSRNQQVLEIARRIIRKFDGTTDYLQWIYTLKLDKRYPEWTDEIYNKIIELTSGLGATEYKIGDEVQGEPKYTASAINFAAENQETLSGSSEVVRGKISSIDSVNGVKVYKIQYNDSSRNNLLVTRTLKDGSIQKKLKVEDFVNLSNINISKEIYQEEHANDPERIPDFMRGNFIQKFTYDPVNNKNMLYKLTTGMYSNTSIQGLESEISSAYNTTDLLYAGNIEDFFNGTFDLNGNYTGTLATSNTTYLDRIAGTFSGINDNKELAYTAEGTRYWDLKRKYIQALADAAEEIEEPDRPNDPYYVMANGILGYWTSLLVQPLSSQPPVLPCIVSPPGNGVYIPIYYGSRKRLADYLRRAFNSGKLYKGPGSGKVVATALAFSFAAHLFELKFIYSGGIPTPTGPVPMIGFVPFVF